MPKRGSNLNRIIARKLACIPCLRACGFGTPTIAKRLRIGKASVSRYLRKWGLPVSEKCLNKGRNPGTFTKAFLARRKINVALKWMRYRAQRCIAKFPPKHTCPRPPAMTDGERFKRDYYSDIEFRLRHLLRRRIRKVITNGVRAGTSLELLGCSTLEFRTHIENLFELGMSWSNYGEWQLDHRKPCAAFDMTKPAHQRACFHFTNYRPMWKLDNIRKNSQRQGVLHRRNSKLRRENETINFATET